MTALQRMQRRAQLITIACLLGIVAIVWIRGEWVVGLLAGLICVTN